MNINQIESRTLKALAHPTRLAIVKKLAGGELCVCDLNEDIELSQSNLSQQLKVLKNAGILSQYRDGKKVIYALKNSKFKDLISLLEEILAEEIEQMFLDLKGGVSGSVHQ